MKRIVKRSAFLFCSGCFLILVPAVWAQYGSSVEGVITDQSGAAVAGATVTATNQATQVSRNTQTNGSGFYRIAGLPPGNYSVVAAATSFKNQTTPNVIVAAEAVRGLNLSLQPGGAQESVTVTAAAGVLQTETASISATISAQEVQNLPQFGSDPYELLRLTPGVFGTGGRQANGNSLGFPNTTGPGGSNMAIFQTENQLPVVADGQRLSSNSYWIDGVSVNSQTWGGTAVVTPNQDSVDQMKISSTEYSADIGRNSGTTVQVITRNGTNNFHGGAEFLYQDPGLNAYSGWSGPVSLDEKPTKVNNKWREYGGSIGGPILKDHLFFFFSYQGLHSDSITYSSPTYIFTPQFNQTVAAARPGTFVNTLLNGPNAFPRVYSVLNPNCAQFIAANWQCQVVGKGLDIGSPYQTDGTYVPVFGTPSTVNGGGLDGIPDLEYVVTQNPAISIPNQYEGRVDYNLGPHQFMWSGLLSKGDQTTNPGTTAPAEDLHYYPENGASTIAWIWTISPTWLNDLRGNVTRWAYNQLGSNTGINWGIPYAYVQNLPGGVPNINASLTSNTGTPADFAENTFEIRDTVNKVFGRHAIKFGGEFTREQNNDNLAGGDRPAYAFAGPWNLVNDTPIYEGIYINPATGGLPVTQRYYRTSDEALFFQDDFKLRPNLTLNLGLRYEYFSPLTEAHGIISNLFPGPSIATGLIDASAKTVSQYTKPDKNNFAPRIGFAWSPAMFKDKTVLRGGFGVAYDRVYDALLTPSREDPPGGAANYGLCCGTASSEFGTPYDQGLIVLGTSSNSIYGYPVSPNLTTLLPLGPNNLPAPGAPLGAIEIYGAPQNFPNPYVFLYSLDIQQELPAKVVFTIGYQGSETRKELRLVDQNFIYNSPNPGVYAAYFATPDVTGNFNSMNINVKRNVASWQFAFNYRWSKSMDELSYGGPGAVTNQTWPRNQKFEYGPSDFDTTNYANFAITYQTPNLGKHSSLINEALGGWQVSGIFTANTGLPWTPVTTQSCLHVTTSQCLSPYRPSDVLKPPVYTNSFHALTTAGVNFPGGGAAYYNLTPGIPAVGRNSFRGPGFHSFDLSLGKGFRVTEGVTVEMRANAFNVFNITNLSPFNFGDTNTIINNPLFGQALTATAGRVMELEGRVRF
jgi:hypothetical protein